MVEGRIAGAEVVEHHPHTEVLDLSEQPSRPLRIAQDHLLRDFQLQAPRVDSGLMQDFTHDLNQAVLRELARR